MRFLEYRASATSSSMLRAPFSSHSFFRPVLVPLDDAQAFECGLEQPRATNCDRGYRTYSEQQHRGESNDARAGEPLRTPASRPGTSWPSNRFSPRWLNLSPSDRFPGITRFLQFLCHAANSRRAAAPTMYATRPSPGSAVPRLTRFKWA